MNNNQKIEGLEIENPVLREIKEKADHYENTGNRTKEQMTAFIIGALCAKIVELDEALKRQVK